MTQPQPGAMIRGRWSFVVSVSIRVDLPALKEDEFCAGKAGLWVPALAPPIKPVDPFERLHAKFGQGRNFDFGGGEDAPRMELCAVWLLRSLEDWG